MNQLEQIVGIGQYRDKPVELLTLSACQTAAGDDRAALGLAGVAVKSGARSALATLWFVNDQATALLVSDFYQHLKDSSVSKAGALQQAQINILSDRRYRHPGYWSPYLLIGNWL
jgi:CHAT domain-containing protein